MLNVAFLTDAPRVAGSEVWLLSVLPGLLELGIRPAVFLPAHAALDELAARMEVAGLPVTRFTALTELPTLTRDFDLRVMQVWDAGTYAKLLPTLAAPRWVMVHDQLEYHYPLGLRPWYRQVYRSTKGPGLRRADGVITVSNWGEAFLRAQFKVEAAYVPNGVDTERYRPRPEAERQALRADFGFTRFTVLVPGRMAPEKNQLAALRTARLARELEFVFVGDMDSPLGLLIQRLKTLWRLDNVRLLGKRWDMPELCAAADALLQPTLAENQSLVTLEAMASGLLVVSSAIPAQAELITDGVDGLLLPPVPDLLARALRFLASRPDVARRLGQAARERVLREHTLSATAAALAPLLQRAANRLD